jgi:hypothetical protein
MTELAARPAALARGVRLEAFTVAWMAIESAVASAPGWRCSFIAGGMPNAELTWLAAPPGPAFALVHRLDSTHRNGVALLDQG